MVRSLCPFYSADLSHFSKDNSSSLLQQLMYYCDCESKHCRCAGATKECATQADKSGGCADYRVELFSKLECCQKYESFAVGCNRSAQIVERRGVFSHHTSLYLGIR